MYGVMASPMCSNAESKSSTPQMDMGKPNVEVTGASRPLCEASVLTDGLEVVADEDWKRKYFELVMAVGNKHPGETRHQTALRYIRQSEAPSTRAAQTEAANVKLSGSTALSASPAPTPGYATEADK